MSVLYTHPLCPRILAYTKWWQARIWRPPHSKTWFLLTVEQMLRSECATRTERVRRGDDLWLRLRFYDMTTTWKTNFITNQCLYHKTLRFTAASYSDIFVNEKNENGNENYRFLCTKTEVIAEFKSRAFQTDATSRPVYNWINMLKNSEPMIH